MMTHSLITPPLEQDFMPQTDLRKHYENMTYDEMTRHMEENYKQLNEMLGNRLSIASTTTCDASEDEHPEEDDTDNDALCLVGRADLSDTEKTEKMTRIFSRAAFSGDVASVKHYLQDETIRTFVDINARDEDGSTPLTYAACFGRSEMAQVLLSAGANIDTQDSFGWTALMWATSNNHDGLVKVLLDQGASAQTRSAKGRTVLDFVNADNQRIVDILSNPRDSMSSLPSLLSSTSSSSNTADCDFYYQSTPEGYESFLKEEEDRRQKLLESAMALVDPAHHNRQDADDYSDAENADDAEEEEIEFYWDRCMPDQMFVFGADDLPRILDTVIHEIQFPIQSREEICLPSNVVFLSARFAHYFSSTELLHDVLDGALLRIGEVTKGNAHNIHVLAFWITNCTQLLYYLKKDTGLVVATADYQLRLSELISEIYTTIIIDTEQRIAKVLAPAMLEHELIPGLEDVHFADDWQRFFRLSTTMSRSNSQTAAAAIAPQPSGSISPRCITGLLSSTFDVLQSYEVHPTVIIQALAQFFHFISCELFNRILASRKLLCRSKALQIRMNLSHIEDWIRHNQLPSSLITYLNPTAQLLQLLQCLTQLDELSVFVSTANKCDSLNALQVKRCVTNYRYEVNEPRLSDEIEAYTLQLADETMRYKQARRAKNTAAKRQSAPPMWRSQGTLLRRTRSSHAESMSQLVGSLIGLTASASTSSTPLPSRKDMGSDDDLDSSSDTPEDEDADEAETIDRANETKDSKFMLPFSVPTTAHMAYSNDWSTAHTSTARSRHEHLVVPVIPDDWMDKLDQGSV